LIEKSDKLKICRFFNKFSKTRPKRKCKKANPEEEEQFRDEIKKIIESKDENTVILYEDEDIFTTEPTVTAIWTKEGHQAIIETSGEHIV